jgi:hypothetical protein
MDLPIDLEVVAIAASLLRDWERPVINKLEKLFNMISDAKEKNQALTMGALILAFSTSEKREDALKAGEFVLPVLMTLIKEELIYINEEHFTTENGERRCFYGFRTTNKWNWVSTQSKNNFRICGSTLVKRYTKNRPHVKGYESINPELRYSRSILKKYPFLQKGEHGIYIQGKLDDYQFSILEQLQKELEESINNLCKQTHVCMRGDDSRGRDVTLTGKLNYQGIKVIRHSVEFAHAEFIKADAIDL